MNVWTIEHAPFPGEHAPDNATEAWIRCHAGMGANVQPSRVALTMVFTAVLTLTLATLTLWGTL